MKTSPAPSWAPSPATHGTCLVMDGLCDICMHFYTYPFLNSWIWREFIKVYSFFWLFDFFFQGFNLKWATVNRIFTKIRFKSLDGLLKVLGLLTII